MGQQQYIKNIKGLIYPKRLEKHCYFYYDHFYLTQRSLQWSLSNNQDNAYLSFCYKRTLRFGDWSKPDGRKWYELILSL